MTPAFITATPLTLSKGKVATPSSKTVAGGPSMSLASAKETLDTYYPIYRRYRAPTITIKGDESVSVSMAPIKAFTDIEKSAAPLLDYSNPSDFVPDIPVPPSAISWPSGDGRGNECNGSKGSFDQADVKKYGPFPDFFKVCLRLPSLSPFLLSTAPQGVK